MRNVSVQAAFAMLAASLVTPSFAPCSDLSADRLSVGSLLVGMIGPDAASPAAVLVSTNLALSGGFAAAAPAVFAQGVPCLAPLGDVSMGVFTNAPGTGPAWWAARGVTGTNAPCDYAAAVQGQVKWLAVQAAAELDERLAPCGGAGAAVSDLVASFSPTNNTLPVTLGQLKNTAKPFHDRLTQLGVSTNYPWSGTPADFALANVGQVKRVFAFDLDADSDGDGIPDGWEVANGLDPLGPADAALDPDADGLSNLGEYAAGADPDDPDTDGDGLADGDEVFWRSDPLVTDTDGDGLADGLEINWRGLAFCGYVGEEGMLFPPATATNAVEVAGGYDFSLALLPDGSVFEWGVGGYGPYMVPYELADVVGIAAGYSHRLALTADGSVTAWGFDHFGETAVPPGLADVVGIAAGIYHSLALKADGTVVAWGDNWEGQCSVPPGLAAVAVAAGLAHNLALKADGTVVAWGSDYEGESTVPPDLTNVVAVAAGGLHSLALKADGTVTAWGSDSSGESTVPPGLTNVVAVAAGYAHSLALKADGTVAAWGSNYYGETEFPSGTVARVISAGPSHSMALARLNPVCPDTDGDGLAEGDEVLIHGSDPVNPDGDGDGLADHDEVAIYGTAPSERDTDGDGFFDGWEIRQDRDPLSHDVLLDPDGDGVPTVYERYWGSDPGSAASVPPPQAFVFVDNRCTNAAQNGSAEAPWADLQHALDAAPDYGIVRIAPGTYAGSFSLGGSASRRMIVEAWDSDNPPTLFSGATGGAPLLDVSGKDRLTLVRRLILRLHVPASSAIASALSNWDTYGFSSGPVLDRLIVIGSAVPGESFAILLDAHNAGMRIQNSLMAVPEGGTGVLAFFDQMFYFFPSLSAGPQCPGRLQIQNCTFLCDGQAAAIWIDICSEVGEWLRASVEDTVVSGEGSVMVFTSAQGGASLARCRVAGDVYTSPDGIMLDDVSFGPVRLNAAGYPATNSPCIDAAGPDAPPRDLTGRARYDHPGVINRNGSAADIGAIEFAGEAADSDGDSLPDDWETAWFGGLAETGWSDADLDGVPNALEWLIGSDPRGWLRVRSDWKGGHMLHWAERAWEADTFLASVFTNGALAATVQASASPALIQGQWAGLAISAAVGGYRGGSNVWSRTVSWRQPATNSYLTAWLLAPALPSAPADAGVTDVFNRQTLPVERDGDWGQFFLSASPEGAAEWQLAGLAVEYGPGSAVIGVPDQSNPACHLPAVPSGAQELDICFPKPSGAASAGFDTPLYLLMWAPEVEWVIPQAD